MSLLKNSHPCCISVSDPLLSHLPEFLLSSSPVTFQKQIFGSGRPCCSVLSRNSYMTWPLDLKYNSYFFLQSCFFPFCKYSIRWRKLIILLQRKDREPKIDSKTEGGRGERHDNGSSTGIVFRNSEYENSSSFRFGDFRQKSPGQEQRESNQHHFLSAICCLLSLSSTPWETEPISVRSQTVLEMVSG